MATQYTVEQLTAIGGKVWEKADMKRVYFNEYKLAELYGLEYDTYKSGMVSSATIDGEPTSNSFANKLLGKLTIAKFWYDFNTNEFRSKGMDSELTAIIVKSIEDKLKTHNEVV